MRPPTSVQQITKLLLNNDGLFYDAVTFHYIYDMVVTSKSNTFIFTPQINPTNQRLTCSQQYPVVSDIGKAQKPIGSRFQPSSNSNIFRSLI